MSLEDSFVLEPEDSRLSVLNVSRVFWDSTGEQHQYNIWLPGIGIAAVYGIIIIVGLVGNVTLMKTCLLVKSMRTVPNLFLSSLALGDLLLLVTCAPVDASRYLVDEWLFGRVGCKLIPFIQLTSVGVSVFTLTALSADRSKRRWITWLAANMTSLWMQFDEDVNQILEATVTGEDDEKLQAMTTIIVSIAAEWFGEEEKKGSRTPYLKNQRAVRIHNIGQEMKVLKSQFKQAGEEEWLSLAQLMFTKELLGQKRSGKLVCSQEDMDQHLKKTHSDLEREQELGEKSGRLSAKQGKTLRQDQTAPRTVPNSCCVCGRSCESSEEGGKIPEQWRVAKGVWIPKKENSTQIDQLHIIFLLCVEAKVLFSAVSNRLCTYLAKNTYIDTSVLKGGISGMPACLDHTGVETQLIMEVRENKGDLYRAIVKPLDIHRSSATLSICLRAGAIWLLSVTLAIPEAVFSDLHTFTTSHTNESFVTCAPYPHAGELHPKIHSTASFLIFYIIPLFIISIYYCFIAHSLVRSSVNIPAEGHLHMQKQIKSRKRLAKTVLVFVGLFAVCWLPSHVIYLYRSYHYDQVDTSLGHFIASVCARILAFTNSCVNPFALYLMSKSFSKHFKKQLLCSHTQRHLHSQNSRSTNITTV
eukprot:superscaffoldBa00000112_g1634